MTSPLEIAPVASASASTTPTTANPPTAALLVTAFAQAGYGVLVTDAAGRLRWLNEAAQSLTGWPAGDAIGQQSFSVMHLINEGGEVLAAPVDTALAAHSIGLQRFAGHLVARNGERHYVEGCVVAVGSGLDREVLLWFEEAGARRRGRLALRQRAEAAEAIVDELAEAVLAVDDTGCVRHANARALRMFGYTRDEIRQQTIPRLMPVPFMNAPDVHFSEYRANPSRRLPRAVAWRKDATHFPAKLVVEPLPATRGLSGYVVLVRDDTEAQRSVNMAQRLGRLLDSAVEEVYIFDANSLYFLEVNRGAKQNLGYAAGELLTMTPLMINDGLESKTLLDYLAKLRGGEAEHLIYRSRHRRADGSVYPVEVRLNFSRDEEPPVFMAIVVDISEREKQEQEMSRLAHFDALTGLPNRPQLALRMAAAMALAANSPKKLAVMFMDIDKFKAINDSYGHDTGDEVLKTYAMRLRQSLRTADTVARLAGDEFVVLAEGINDRDGAARVATKLHAAIRQPITVGEQTLHITSSIGITLYPDDDGDMESLLKHADEAMYEAKRGGPGETRFYEVLRPGAPTPAAASTTHWALSISPTNPSP
ncbi:MAG TPA: diguanylate cyclase [Nevskiaceae bacterium]|nr:diguanylate cyclase [Nevskiaceae bacterium]